MEQGPLNNAQLDYLARHDPVLRPVFQGVFASNQLPNNPITTKPAAYLVNQDPAGPPGHHWLALWTTHDQHCELFDSCGLPLKTYQVPLLEQWVHDHRKYVTTNGRALQAYTSQTCGDDAFFFFKNESPRSFPDGFSPRLFTHGSLG